MQIRHHMVFLGLFYSFLTGIQAVVIDGIPGPNPNFHFPDGVSCWKNYPKSLDQFLITRKQLESIVSGKVVRVQQNEYSGFSQFSGYGVELRFAVSYCPKQRNNLISFIELRTNYHGGCMQGAPARYEPGHDPCDY
ncbi:protein of unknown function [Taphrina deformans PYCC 5710]|uniref:Uncharacterized protein n=1 Tax=Taphrina deformans (strain PYCC 5710 / ATCC 11124 / CBS 356.35 / IMI 108563 / JCM 9778 / NBRC 8474) TaxID=1097556 RepID=R4X6L8_TAPDE|nr:protein of unknown function [Taphrina deformans PYCC 5710]|eukprot:CCG80521.1 protein of unknown function [Taphrina deformans PYCC 5710]